MKQKTWKKAHKLKRQSSDVVFKMEKIEKRLESESLEPSERVSLQEKHEKLKTEARKLASEFAGL